MFHVKHLPLAAASRPCVRVVLPSGALRDADLPAFEDGIARLIAAGFDVRFDPLRADARWRDYYAGSDATRAAEFIAALSEPGVDIVWWGRGGSGSARLLPSVLDAARALPPRILIGFSDATALLNAFAVQLGWLTFHGPAITSIARTDLDRLRAVVCGESRTAPLWDDGAAWDASQTPPAALEGCVFGGNLTVLTTVLGTPSQPPSSRTIWLLEDVNEPSYSIDRALRHLKDAGGTCGAVGAWCGSLHPTLDAHIAPTDATSSHAASHGTASPLRRIADDLALPCLPGFPGGHTGPMHLVPIGAHVRIDPIAGALTGTHPWVRPRHSHA